MGTALGLLGMTTFISMFVAGYLWNKNGHLKDENKRLRDINEKLGKAMGQ